MAMTGVLHLIFLPPAGWRWVSRNVGPDVLTRVGLVRCSSGRAALLCHCGQERHNRIGHLIGGAPGQVMTRALDELQASVRECLREPAGGADGNLGVVR